MISGGKGTITDFWSSIAAFMSTKLRVILIASLSMALIWGITSPFYGIYKEGPQVQLNLCSNAPNWASCKNVQCNFQGDTIVCCETNGQIEIQLRLAMLNSIPSPPVEMKKGRYHTGYNRTYSNDWISQGISYTGSSSTDVPVMKLHIAVDSLVPWPNADSEFGYVGDYVSISDDDSRLLLEVRTGRRSRGLISLLSFGNTTILRIRTGL